MILEYTLLVLLALNIALALVPPRKKKATVTTDMPGAGLKAGDKVYIMSFVWGADYDNPHIIVKKGRELKMVPFRFLEY